ncbi:hypothetical protein [Fluviicola sp.]|uniref:hypothetical protein n=1 Tax=Fluviicola sp. TaxID=1917219 RepID=UPI0026143317|nr:hypothetical protein [Fluviicola sp.]
MTPQEYSDLKFRFEELTGKNAEDNLEAFFSFVNTMVLMDMQDIMKIIRLNLPKPNAGLK